MRKFLILFSAFMMSIGLMACSSEGEGNSAKKKSSADSAADQQKVKKSLVHLYSELANTINSKDTDLNTYEASGDSSDAKMKTNAQVSAAAVAEELKKVKIPAELKNQSSDLEAAIKDFTDSYQTKAEELKKSAPALDGANEIFTKGEDKMGKVFEDAKLLKPSLNKEVNG
ncbi:hypothetical protein [Bacillus sp. MUM 13]|uniref:hypothetical protein n=1 Tax=Bacillus sp. MUM 13 TaxID=1678001 RepID=UPI0008F5B693|nr:hypothetical protein [Bacillus sp. MUM 13]OIK14730.1 hypothetical protein BIV59_01965 [Bacillus sp. MUM 13]